MFESEALQKRAAAFVREKYGAAFEVAAVGSLPQPAYGIEPKEWAFFAVFGPPVRVGGTEYVAVNKTTGEVRDLGMIGD